MSAFKLRIEEKTGSPLALTARNTADKLISDNSVGRVGNSKHAQQQCDNLVLKFLLRHPSGSLSRGLCIQSKLQGLGNGECRLMDFSKVSTSNFQEHGWSLTIILLVINALASVQLRELLGSEQSIFDLAVDIRISMALVGNDLQERCAPTSGPSKHKAHLSGLQHTLEVLKNIVALAL